MSGLPQDAPPDGPPPRRRSPVRRLACALAALLLSVALALVAFGWALRSSGGTAWVLARLPGVTVTAPQGSLIGDFSAGRVEIALPGASNRLVIGGLRWRGLSFARAASDTSWLRLEIDSLQADRVDVLVTPDPSAPPLAPPQSLRLPLEIELHAIDIAELHASLLGALPLRGLRAQLHLSADAGRTHRIDVLSLAWDRLAASGAASISSAAPYDVEAQLAIAPRQTDPLPGQAALPPFDATLTARGPLAVLALQATLRGTAPAARPGTPAPSLDLRASVLPFAAWPLGALQAQTRALDLAALYSNAPGTSLTGTAQLESAGSDRPATVTIALSNARAGRIDEGLLPLRSLQADVGARPDDPANVDIRALDIALGTARETGGRVQGNGSWTPRSTSLDATLTDIAPRVLDARAPAMRFSGRADLRADDWLGSTGRSGADTTPSLLLRGHFSGNLPQQGRQQGVRLDLDATATSGRIELKAATLQGGDSSATFSGLAVRQGSGGWQLKGQGALARFDPAQWWPGTDGSAWRKGPHRFNGTLALDALLPANAGKATLSVQQLATTRGQATLRVSDSLLAGAPLTGEFTLRGEGESGLDVGGSLDLAGAKLSLRGRLAPNERDHWEIEAIAADLAPWAALLQLARPPGAPALSLAGGLDGEARFDGRWPQISSSGRLALTDLRASKLRLARAALRWTASTAPQAPLDVQAEIEQLGFDPQKLDRLRVSVHGTAAEHRITISAESPVRPPSWVDVLHGADKAPAAGGNGEPATGTLAELSAQGALQFDVAWQQPLRWHGRVLQLDARRRGGNLPAPWFHGAESDLDAQYDPASGTPRFTLGPGRAELPGLALRWDQFRWQGGSAPLLDLQAEFEPFSAAPMLARLQPDFGWGGDLVLAGHLRVRSAPSFVAEVELGRQRGDLNVTDEAGTQELELTDLRLGLDARDGVWNFTTALAGKSLGAMAGEATVRTDAKARWPPAAAPLQGVLEVQLANLAAWGAWAPPGWRMKGALHASASLGGTFGAPEYTGQIEGSGLGVRNLAEGVDLHDGEVRITLQGETARIERLEAHAGDGSLRVSGGAVFGASPQAKLRVVAERMLLLGRVDRRIVASGDATLQLDPHSLALDGSFVVDQGLIDFSRGNAPTLADDVHVLRAAKTANPDAATPRAGPAREVKMNLALNLGPALRLRGRGLDTRLQGELRLTAPGGRLAVNGTVNAAPGTYAAYGQKLTIERGTVSFSGAIENPRLDILALRPNLDIRVGVAVTGNAITPRIALFSDPDLPDNEKLSWLVLGRAPEGVGGSDTALIQAAAMALLAGEGDGQLSELTRLNPLDTLSVRKNEGVVHDTVVSVGKQLSQRWYIGYERSLTATSGNWQLIYRLAQRFTVRLQTGLDNSIDLIWSWRWQ